ncbi:MAG: hypothetical protein PCFJNLEI_01096 [Verrucomicrobiae bacterium]|nr:hypothetical protein [Verrucomicrobiae bacterium]
MNLLDFLAAAYLAFGVWRGRKRGIIKEAPGTVSLLVLFFSGWGLMKSLYRGLLFSSEMVGHSVGVFTFIGLVIATVVLWRKIRARIRMRAERLCPEVYRSRAGAVAGGVKALVFAAIMLLILAKGPFRGLAQGSGLGSAVIWMMLPAQPAT